MKWLTLLVACLLASAAPADRLRLAVTTSFENSGLADVLLPAYEAATGARIDLVIAGTGRALRLGAAGDVDAVLTHAPEAEAAAVAAGDYLYRRPVMYNDFVLIGPSTDPAALTEAASAADAMLRIAQSASLFASRGDESGTHNAERALWAAAGFDPAEASGRWYRETGSGMGATLNTAVALGAYALTDRASWLTFGNQRDMAILYEGDPALFNQYAFLPAANARAPEAVAGFEAWITGPGQAVIAGYTLEGETLFTPNAE